MNNSVFGKTMETGVSTNMTDPILWPQTLQILLAKTGIFQCILIWVQGLVELGNLRHFSQFWEFSQLSSTYKQLLSVFALL